MFKDTGGFIGVIGVVKKPEQELLTLNVWKEIDQFQKIIFNSNATTPDGTVVRFLDLCVKFGDDEDECYLGEGPMTFITDEDGNIVMPRNDAYLLRAI